MQVLKKVLIGIGVVLVVLVVVVALFLGPIIKTSVETIGPQVTGVDITLEKAGINLLTGNVKLKGLIIGNPEGFKTPSLMELNQFVVDLNMGSLFTDTIVIKKIHIDGPQITYEQALRSSNFSTLLKNLEPDEKAPAEEPDEKVAKKKKAPAKKVVIEDFLFENGNVNVSITLAGGKQLTVPLATIHLEDIGKETDGASITEVVNEVFGAISKSAASAVAASGDLAGDALKGTADLAGDALKGTGDLIKDPSKSVDAVKDAGSALKKGLGGLLEK